MQARGTRHEARACQPSAGHKVKSEEIRNQLLMSIYANKNREQFGITQICSLYYLDSGKPLVPFASYLVPLPGCILLPLQQLEELIKLRQNHNTGAAVLRTASFCSVISNWQIL